MYLAYIVESVDLINEYVAGDRRRLDTEQVVQDAVLRRLETLSDAASKLSPEIKAAHPEIPWPAVQAFRNRLAHAYLGVDLDRTWAVMDQELGALRSVARQELERIERDPEREPGH